MNNKQKKGFTLIEILLVIAAISILASIVIVAINPAKQLGETRNAQRRSDVKTILDAVWQYAIDNDGVLPTVITTTPTEICKTAATCSGGIDLFTNLVGTTEKYLVSIPVDPKCPNGPPVCISASSVGYKISKSSNGRVTVQAPQVEQITTATASQTPGGGVTTVVVDSGGSGYTAVPPVTITNVTCTGTGVGTATIASGAVATIITTGLTCTAGQTFTVTVTSPIFVSR